MSPKIGAAYEDPMPLDVVVFLDGDYSDYPEQLPHVVQPIIEGRADMVIGSRALGRIEKGSMTPQQVFGNWLATRLLKLFYGVKFTDLGPFRAIRYESLVQAPFTNPRFAEVWAPLDGFIFNAGCKLNL